MKTFLLVAATAALTLGPPLYASPQSAPSKDAPQAKPEQPDDKKPLPSLTGKWAMELAMAMGQSTPALTVKQEGEKITGTYTGRYGSFPLEGTIKGRAIQFSVTINVEGMQVDMSFSGEVAADGQTMKGEADLGQAGDGTWIAGRDKTADKAEGKRHF
jgi:hypothetical protein